MEKKEIAFDRDIEEVVEKVVQRDIAELFTRVESDVEDVVAKTYKFYRKEDISRVLNKVVTKIELNGDVVRELIEIQAQLQFGQYVEATFSLRDLVSRLTN